MVVRKPYKKVAITHKSDERLLLEYYLKRDNEELIYKATAMQAKILADEIQSGRWGTK